jgi:hypothetical protein
MKLLFLLFIAGVTVLAQAASANGQCTCAGERRADGEVSRYTDAYDELVHSDAVFVGEVLSLKKGTQMIPDYAKIQYEEVVYKVVEGWKGVGGERITIRLQVVGCVMGFKKGSRMLIFAKRIEGNYWTGCCCSRNSSIENAGDYLKLFRKKGLEPITPGQKKI